jgi:hypothetical protein
VTAIRKAIEVVFDASDYVVDQKRAAIITADRLALVERLRELADQYRLTVWRDAADILEKEIRDAE